MYTVENVRTTLQRILTVAGFLAKFTPNTVDDKVIEVANILVNNDDALALLVQFLNNIGKDKSDKEVVQVFMEHFAE